ncbi:MAG: DUF2218 domain-containing protein [Devosia sp.]|nr:DUF2218 domain-containing protein [Devosia sp.]
MEANASPLSADARVATTSARRYLGQLCKHFQHKLPATYDELYRHGRIEFPIGVCELEAADEGALTMRVFATSAADLDKLQEVVARHLERFAFRETLNLTWTVTQ